MRETIVPNGRALASGKAGVPDLRSRVPDPKSCPDELELLDLARGNAAEGRGPILRDHIGDCEACRIAVAELLASDATEETAEPPDEGRDPGRYELRRLLAQGGMGEVFVARDRVLDRDVAIKFLHEDTGSPDALAESRRRVLREAQALASFAHPNVVAVYDQGILDGRAFLAMEYVRGRTLRQWIEEEKPGSERIKDVLVQAGRGLLAAHEIGLVHRDFKPDNVLVGDDGRARVTDFGLARMAPREGVEPGKAGVVLTGSSTSAGSTIAGTPAYMAPEQLEGKPADARSDQYAFCVTFYEASHGARPEVDRTQPDRASAKPRRGLTPSARVDAVLARGLSASPADRFASMREVLAALEASPKGGHRGLLVGGAAALLALSIGVWLFSHRGAARLASASAALHAPCIGVSGGCPAPLVCRYPSGNYCGASGAPGVCAWPEDSCSAKSPVACGCNGVTYANGCDAHGAGVSSAYRGPCVPCTAGAACDDVNTVGVRAPAFCRVDADLAPADVSRPRDGVCWPRPSACAAGGPPVCGWDGLTYGSACEARRAGTDAEREGPCSSVAAGRPATSDASVGSGGLTTGAPDEQGMDARPLVALARWIEAEKLPIFSILISRHGVLVYELYTSSIGRDDAHYLWGATFGVTSALMGVAIDRHVVAGPETTVADALPRDLFPSEEARERFRKVTVRDVLGMSALDAPIPPHDVSETAKERQERYLGSKNRVGFALTQPTLPEPGSSRRYTEITADLATGILEYGTKTTALELAEESLFGPMDFRNYEWMHQDRTGIDAGGYGLRLRPFDMQKLGLLYLQRGVWEKRRLLSSDWTIRSFSPWLRATTGVTTPTFGWGWWVFDFGHVGGAAAAPGTKDWSGHVVSGWKGQRIAVFEDQGVVLTVTAMLEPPEDEAAIFRRIVRDYLMPSIDGTGTGGEPARPDPALRKDLADVLARVQTEPVTLKGDHPDAVPSIAPKGQAHRPFGPR